MATLATKEIVGFKKIISTTIYVIGRSCVIGAVSLLAGCTGGVYQPQQEMRFGAQDFVLDSYKIREGRSGILALQGRPDPPFEKGLLQDYDPVIEEGDQLEIALYQSERPDLAQAVADIGKQIGFTVMHGQVTLPILGSAQVAGLTLEEARAALETAYRQKIAHIELFLAFKTRKQAAVELVGCIQQRTEVVADGRLRLFEALSQAHLPSEANLFKSYVVRQGGRLPVDLNQLVKFGNMDYNIVLRGGDQIYIASPNESNLAVLGEVRRPGLIPLPNGYLSLREAIALSGDIPYTGNRQTIQIFRSDLTSPKIYTLSWKHLVELPPQSLLLMPGDIVYVSTRPITRWNRFVTQVLPSLVGLDLITRSSHAVVAIP